MCHQLPFPVLRSVTDRRQNLYTQAPLRLLCNDLDAVADEAGGGTKRTLVARRALAAAIAQQSGWVTQGVYLWWCEPLARDADRIVWLDVAWRVAASRIMRRHRTCGPYPPAL